MNQRSFIPTPYPLTETVVGYTFTTDSSEQYSIYYSPAVAYFPGLDEIGQHAFMFGFTRLVEEGKEVDDDTPSDDPRVKATIFKELSHFFEDSTKILVYVCQDGKKQRAGYRHRLFGRWFGCLKNASLVRRVVHEADGLYASFIYSVNSPFARALLGDLPTMDEKITRIASQEFE